MGNVLVHFCHDRMCTQIGSLCNLDGPTVKRNLFGTGLQHDFERGRITEVEMHQRIQEITGATIDFNELYRASSDIFTLNDSIVPILDILKSRGHRLVLLSNTSISHLSWVKQEYDVLNRFDQLVTSYEVGAIKPESPIFEAALAAAQCEPGECFYTDDIAEYVNTARTYGIDAEVFTDTQALIGHLRERGIDVERA
ncbi:MAG: HAD family phosphatase [Planctomycetaceae bacterium]|nr:HAD family phosphatase [Planctomycetaceae bacterium]